jgi:catechol 2,3-dioxygenase-like lactoylglutathione lyase family enzyme
MKIDRSVYFNQRCIFMLKAKTRGVHHVGLAVNDIDAARRFFEEVLGFHKVGERPAYPAVFISDGHTLLTLWQVKPGARPFDRQQQVGLHHLALRVEDQAALQACYALCMDYPGVTSEFAPAATGAGEAWHCMLMIPGGVRLELIGL